MFKDFTMQHYEQGISLKKKKNFLIHLMILFFFLRVLDYKEMRQFHETEFWF